VPHATLHVIGKINEYLQTAGHPAMAGSVRGKRVAHLRAAMKTAKEAGGVKFFGPLPRAALLEELSHAACFPFPASVSAPCETFSISILECCALGIPVVLTPVDALGEVYATSGVVMVPGPAEYSGEQFADAVAEVLVSSVGTPAIAERERRFASLFTFDAAAAKLDAIIRKHHKPVTAAQEAAAQ
jgi:glycosyltransferase involved in cell wall biosynthesis